MREPKNQILGTMEPPYAFNVNLALLLDQAFNFQFGSMSFIFTSIKNCYLYQVNSKFFKLYTASCLCMGENFPVLYLEHYISIFL